MLANRLRMATGTWRTLASYTADKNTVSFNGFAIRIVIDAAGFASVDGKKMRFTFQASSGAGEQLNIASARVYEQAAAGDAYDGHATNNSDITFDGGNGGSGTITTGAQKLSDEIDVSWFDNTKALVIAIGVTGVGLGNAAAKTTIANWESYTKTAASGETDTADVSTYSPNDDGIALVKVEVFS